MRGPLSGVYHQPNVNVNIDIPGAKANAFAGGPVKPLIRCGRTGLSASIPRLLRRTST
jgi:hypothetical protein